MHQLPQDIVIQLGLDDADDPKAIGERVARDLGVSPGDLPPLEVKKRSIDARKGHVRFQLTVGAAQPLGPLAEPPPREVRGPARVVIVGDGPAGLFCAYELARHGIAAVVLDRGKPVQPRRKDLKGLNVRGEVDPDSNYCFGEGGAGTYSDGKLYTRSHKRGNVRDVLEILHLHGAPAAILTDARPHIGSNKLPMVVTALRGHLEQVGVEFRFGARVVALCQAKGTVTGVTLSDGEQLEAQAVVVATGHSARDVFRFLTEAGVQLEAKPFALGLRIEHPQPLINHIQYGRFAGHPKLPAASYRLAHTDQGRGVFSFCMCPGGFIVPAATDREGLVVNGMSLSRRDSPFANSGLVTSIELADLEQLGSSDALGGVRLQQRVEAAALAAGGGALRAPATRVTDFLAGRGSSTVPKCSYRPGILGSDVGAVLAESGLSLAQRLRDGLRRFGGNMRGFVSEEAVLVATESRTSAPVRVRRDPDTLQCPELAGVFPAGEGAGYAGGIVSAAVDGMRIARAIAQSHVELCDSSTRVISAGAPSRMGGPQ
ncbi:MAG: FAD-dependent oxidoreductase [Polyangiaceae bacterium]